ncbi:helix-turn-helix domain-containing protein [Corynebacterium auriscanis]|uniref:hypothetical protein n=1 Tax=Corynebacterium auriscanis TaxID=99807 RepID=UPI002245ED0D|nr:hypothetical protein [Corynebacterium auriscanis]MCX2163353.1 hypothetical protein [Corynebacterium auriscanis]
MNSPAALDKPTLLGISSATQPSVGGRLTVAVLTAIAAFTAASPQKGTLPALILLFLALAIGLVWWFTLRHKGKRGNDYSPMKTDAELARTPWSWKEEGRGVIVLLLMFIPLNMSRLFASWAFATVFAVLAGVIMWIAMRSPAWRPVHYSLVKNVESDGALHIRNDAEWLRAYLYASQIVPGGYQIRTDALTESVAHYGMDANATQAALNELVRSGQAVLIRELRSHDGRVHWVTLTEKGREAFKKSVGLPLMPQVS